MILVYVISYLIKPKISYLYDTIIKISKLNINDQKLFN